jgi:hypothetical protein
MAESQNYKNHVRFHTPFHFFLFPVLLFHFLYTIVRCIQDFSFDRAEAVVVSVALIVMLFLLRLNPLRVQDRVIRLEENLRYQKLLPAGTALAAAELPIGKITALRFASDEELPELIKRVLQGELKKSAEIKSAIKNWRADKLRV